MDFGCSKSILLSYNLDNYYFSVQTVATTMPNFVSSKEDPSQKREYFLRFRPLSEPLAAYVAPNFKVQKSERQQRFILVEELKPHTKYEFAVLASDGERNSTWSMMVWNVTQEAGK